MESTTILLNTSGSRSKRLRAVWRIVEGFEEAECLHSDELEVLNSGFLSLFVILCK